MVTDKWQMTLTKKGSPMFHNDSVQFCWVWYDEGLGRVSSNVIFSDIC